MSPKELAGLHGLVSQVAFGLLLAFYNREKPIQSFDVPLLQLQLAGVRARSIAHCTYVGFFACFHAISLERSSFRKIAFLFSCFCSPQAAGIAHRPPRNLYCKNKRRQTDRQTDGQTKYCNPRCACAPRVNDDHTTVVD